MLVRIQPGNQKLCYLYFNQTWIQYNSIQMGAYKTIRKTRQEEQKSGVAA